MITSIPIPFGFALRHKIYYNPHIKRGHLLLWSFYKGKLSGKDPNKLGRGFSGQLFASEYSKLGTTRHTKIPIGKGNELLSFLAAFEIAIKGKKYIFDSYEGREISFTPNKEKDREWEILVKIGINENTGKLLYSEAKTLGKIMEGLLREIGYEKEEIEERVEKLINL